MKSRADRLMPWLIAGLMLGTTLTSATVPAVARDKLPPAPATGPAADYPMVLGAPFTIDGVTYTPADTLNYDKVGYAVVDPALGQGISVAHRTLPLPSYAEITSLRTGRTILVRVERRGPMSGNAMIALSPGAAEQLGTGDPLTPIRIRRVNPPEPERALLRRRVLRPAHRRKAGHQDPRHPALYRMGADPAEERGARLLVPVPHPGRHRSRHERYDHV